MTFQQFKTACTVMAFACALSASPAQAQGNSQGRGNSQGKAADQGKKAETTASVTVQFGFNTRDREIVTTYYTTRAKGLPPGLAKRDDLPPGLEKQLKRNGSLPPGLDKKLQPLPVELDRRLVRLPADYRRFVLGVHVVVMNTKTNLVVDFMLNVVR